MLELLTLFGITTGQFVFGSIAIGSGIVAKTAVDMSIARQEREKRKANEDYEKMMMKKKQIEVSLFDENKHKENEEIKKNYDQMQVDKKSNELKNDRIINTHLKRIPYKGIKVNDYNELLFGFDIEGKPLLLTETNYCLAAPTRIGKSKRAGALLLNWLANKQGPLFIADLKRIDWKVLKGKRGVVYIDKIEHLKELVEAFKAEFLRREELLSGGNYININDYNKHNPDKKERAYLLLIEEFPIVSSTYTLPNGKPMPNSVYAEIISLSMLIGYTGGHIVITSQRGTADFLSGALKANINFIAMRTVDTNNSKLVIGSEGCERLHKTESLLIHEGKLTKAFSYDLTDDMIRELCDKLS